MSNYREEDSDEEDYYNDDQQQQQLNPAQFPWGNPPPNNTMQFTQLPPTQPDPNELIQRHCALHQASIHCAMQLSQNMMATMQTNSMATLQQPHHQTQIGYVPQPFATGYLPPAQYPPIPDPQRDVPVTATEETKEYKEALAREAKKFDSRLDRLEQSQVADRRELQAKERALAQSQAEEQRLHQQLLEAERRHSDAMSSVARSGSTPQATPAFTGLDMAALQRVIDELQRDKLSEEDVKDLVGNAVQTQLAGLARSSDIESAAAHMEKGLRSVPAGASNAEVQQIVEKQLEKAVQKVAKLAPAQQRRLGNSQHQMVAQESQAQYSDIAGDDRFPAVTGQHINAGIVAMPNYFRSIQEAPSQASNGASQSTGDKIIRTSRHKKKASDFTMPMQDTALVPQKSISLQAQRPPPQRTVSIATNQQGLVETAVIPPDAVSQVPTLYPGVDLCRRLGDGKDMKMHQQGSNGRRAGPVRQQLQIESAPGEYTDMALVKQSKDIARHRKK